MAKHIPLVCGTAFAIIDDEDFEKVSKYRWSLHRSDKMRVIYARTNIRIVGDGRARFSTVPLHRFIMDAGSDELVDHRDGDGLNCRRENLRKATRQQNGWNSRPNLKATSRFKGVSWQESRQRWFAALRFNNRSISIGRFKDEIAAARAYNEAALRYYGEFAWLNPID